MFAPKVAKPMGKAAGSSTGSLTFSQSMRVQDRAGHNPTGRACGGQMIAPEVSRTSSGAAWDFSKIRVFPADWVPSHDRDALPEIIQPKLAIGRVDDPLELEADRIADQVMRMVEPSVPRAARVPQVSRKCAACEDDEAKMLQRKPVGPDRAAAGETPPIAHDVLRLPGEPLEADTLEF